MTRNSSIGEGGRVCPRFEFRAAGFTFIELMAALTIVALLMVIAIPSYMSSLKRGVRIEARTELMGIAEYLAKVSLNSATGRLPSEQMVSADQLLSRPSRDYDYAISVVENGLGYWVVAMPKKGGRLSGDGAQSLSHTSAGCWYKEKDNPEVNESCNLANYEVW